MDSTRDLAPLKVEGLRILTSSVWAGPRLRLLLAGLVNIGLSLTCPPRSGAGPGCLRQPLSPGLEPHTSCGASGEALEGAQIQIARSRRGAGEQCTWVHAATFGSERAGSLPAPWL